ncbi:MAG: alpha/beta hydrolase [Akkermansiaceae bacterium]
MPLLKKALQLSLAGLSTLLPSCLSTRSGTLSDRPPVKSAKVKYDLKKDVIFTPADWPKALPADIYEPTTSGKRPAILLIHGGGWTGGDKRSQMNGLAEKLASRGYVVMNTTYRTTPENQWPTQIEDVRLALRWLQKNAPSLRVDPEKIGAMGYSAGAHLAAILGSTNPDIEAMVLGGLPSDLMLFNDGKLVRMLTGGTKAEKPQVHRDASPVNFVTKDTPPVFLYHGRWDKLVPPNQAEAYLAALQKNNVPYEMTWLKGRAHITTFLFSGSTVDRGIDFFDRILR